jgi:hypothetical protein
MPTKIAKACKRCFVAHTNDGGYCDACLPAEDTPRKHDHIDRLYHTAAWLRFSKMMRGLNPICQRIDRDYRTGDPEQCRTQSQEVHHILSPRVDPANMWKGTNVVCLCRSHHPKNEGTPDWKPGVDYVPTKQPSHHV